MLNGNQPGHPWGRVLLSRYRGQQIDEKKFCGAVNHGQFVGSANNICLVLASSAEDDMLLEQSNFCLTLSLFLIWDMITCTHHTIQTVLLYTIKNFISEIGFQVYLVYLLEKCSVLRFQRWAIGTGGMEQYIFSSWPLEDRCWHILSKSTSDEVGKKATLY